MKQNNNYLNNIIFLLLNNIFAFWDLPYKPQDYSSRTKRGNTVTLVYTGRVKLTIKIVADPGTQTILEYSVKII